jgi:murein L,D-transpeptidase YafK
MKAKKVLIGLVLILITCLIMGFVVFLASKHSTDLSSKEPPRESVDLIVVKKSEHRMFFYADHQLIRTYLVSLGKEHGPKVQEGDHRTPEGHYKIVGKNKNSDFYRSLLLSYPNKEDRERAQKLGVSPGGQVEIHGLQNDLAWVGVWHRALDWTDGCIAVTNEEIDEIFSLVDVGTPVVIEP